MSSSTCCSQVFRGRPGGRFQSAAGGLPVWASIDSCSACEAGVFSGRRQMWPNNEWYLSAIRDGRSGSFVLSLITALDTLSYHLVPRIRRSVPAYEKTGSCHCLLCALSTFQSHIWYNTTDCTREVYILNLVERLSNLLTPNVVKLGHNGTSNAQASVYLWVGVAFGIYIRA